MTDSTDNVQRSLGYLEGQASAQDERLTRMEADMKGLNAKLDTVVGYIERQKGSRRTLLAVGSALASACGAGAALAVQVLTGRHG